MCEDHGHVHVPTVDARTADTDWHGEILPLEPVDEVSVLTVCDNSIDVLLVDHGPARRLSLATALGGGLAPLVDAPMLEEGTTLDAPLAEHGFSALVEVRKATASTACSSTPA